MEQVYSEKDLKELAEFSKDEDWFEANHDLLLSKFKDSFVAIKDQRVIDSDKDIESLLRRLGENAIDTRKIPIRFVTEEKTIHIF